MQPPAETAGMPPVTTSDFRGAVTSYERALRVVPLEILMEFAWEPGASQG